MDPRKIAASAGAAVAGVIVTLSLVSACGSGSPQTDDLKNIPDVYPNYAVTVLSPDNFPNYVMSCFKGVGVMLTTRDNSAAAAQLVPAWNSFCQSQEGKQASQDGQP